MRRPTCTATKIDPNGMIRMMAHATAVVHINQRNPRDLRESNHRLSFHEPLSLMIQVMGFDLAYWTGRDAPSYMYGNEN
jgi:hypothetical protein